LLFAPDWLAVVGIPGDAMVARLAKFSDAVDGAEPYLGEP
jgi:hypothetical protein